ncbi:hypothetical protein B0F90DRAFT_1751188 [Multifurca ochricompacta]|uniref:Uncharacterized protein n=1 Tax=Multifurca ochricompacta TaxID=376703 RepID=A0AAD4QJR8_9AGAM|nr:hypothetical protein B0F90DRAFT_1751188 [Multifurca ochricompacta]
MSSPLPTSPTKRRRISISHQRLTQSRHQRHSIGALVSRASSSPIVCRDRLLPRPTFADHDNDNDDRDNIRNISTPPFVTRFRPRRRRTTTMIQTPPMPPLMCSDLRDSPSLVPTSWIRTPCLRWMLAHEKKKKKKSRLTPRCRVCVVVRIIYLCIRIHIFIFWKFMWIIPLCVLYVLCKNP